MANPDLRAKIVAGANARWMSPDARAKQSVRMKAVLACLPPEVRERLRAAGRKGYQAGLATPAGLAITNSPEVRARAGASISATKLAHIPPAYRAAYRELTKGGASKAEASALIAEQVATDQRRATARLAGMTKHERDLERVRNGAALVERVAMPSRELTFTPGGVASGML